MLKVLAISGSLKSSSTNTTILRSLAISAPSNLQISIYEGIGNLPHFNPELDGDLPLDSVRAWRDCLQLSDGIIFCCFFRRIHAQANCGN